MILKKWFECHCRQRSFMNVNGWKKKKLNLMFLNVTIYNGIMQWLWDSRILIGYHTLTTHFPLLLVNFSRWLKLHRHTAICWLSYVLPHCCHYAAGRHSAVWNVLDPCHLLHSHASILATVGSFDEERLCSNINVFDWLISEGRRWEETTEGQHKKQKLYYSRHCWITVS